ncbi:hypothetical protein BH11PSE12_BH11PSE12_05940 [soil metagenome]
MKSHAFVGAICTAIFICNYSHADDIDPKASAFAKNYSDICIRNLPDLEALRVRLSASLPKFPPGQAAHFLQGKEGDAWPIPSKEDKGNFVLTLLEKKNVCSLYGRRANAKDVEKLFSQLVGRAPQPLTSERKEDVWMDPADHGKGHIISYVWSLPDVKRKFLFMLTTSESDNADAQAFATASTISE